LRKTILLLAWCWCLDCTCDQAAIPPPAPSEVVEDSGWIGRVQNVEIRGEHFLAKVERSLGEEDPFVVDDNFTAVITHRNSGDPVVLEVEYQNSHILNAVIPEGIDTGRYDLTVTGPYGLSGFLENAYQAVEDEPECETSADCENPTPVCNSDRLCVACQSDPECQAINPDTPLCDLDTGACVECTLADQCDDSNPCTDDDCVSSACVNTPNTAACEDGDACTSGDVCSSGICQGTPTPDGDPCDAGVCCQGVCRAGDCCQHPDCQNPTPVCSPEWICSACQNDPECSGINPDTPLCDTDSGACVECIAASDCPIQAPVCSPEGTCLACTQDSECLAIDSAFPICDEQAGICVQCENQADCQAPTGLCDPATNLCVECYGAGQCNDSNPCTDDECVDTACVNAPNTGACQDGNACTENDTCSGGICAGSDVTDGDPCAGGLCCAGECRAGDCCAAAVCQDGNPCTTNTCDSYNCTTANNSAPCDDGNECTDLSTCTDGACPDGAPLDDMTACSAGGGVCCGGTCQTGNCCVDQDCNDDNPCTDEPCIANACANSPNTVPCDDGRECTVGDTCSDGSCQSGPDQPDLTACESGTGVCCTGDCQTGECCTDSDCDDGEECTVGEACVSGSCQAGSAVLDLTACASGTGVCCAGACETGDCCQDSHCDDANDCTDDTCLAFNCDFVDNADPCDDSNDCTFPDNCSAGSCQGPGLPDLSACGGGSGVCCGSVCMTGDCCVSLDCINPMPICGSGNTCGPCQTDPECLDRDPAQPICNAGSCEAGECVVDADCGPGELCRPACFGGDGCGLPPAGMDIQCNPNPVDLASADTSDCLIDLGLTGQAACLQCTAGDGLRKTDYSDFTDCDLNGWSYISGSTCYNNVTSCAGAGVEDQPCCDDPVSTCISSSPYYLISSIDTNCGGGLPEWRIEKTVNMSGRQAGQVCMKIADVSAGDTNAVLIYASDGTNGPDEIFCLNGPPRRATSETFYWFCGNLPGWANDNPAVTVQLVAHVMEPGRAYWIDDLELFSWPLGCPPTYQQALLETFSGCPNPIGDGWNDWSVSSSLPNYPECPGFACPMPGSGNGAMVDDAWMRLERVVDASALDSRVELRFVVGDDGAAGTSEVEVFFNAGSGWQRAFYKPGNIGPNGECAPVYLNLSDLDPDVNNNPALGIAFDITANNGQISLFSVSLSGAVDCLAGSQVDLGPIGDNGDGSYSFTAQNAAGTPLMGELECHWDTPPVGQEVQAAETLWFLDSLDKINLVAESENAVIESFTSEYCDPGNLPGNCQPGYWYHQNINDGHHAHGYDAQAFRDSWASSDKNGNGLPEEFVFSFDSGRAGWVYEVVVQNYGEEGGAGPYYATHFILYGQPPGGGAWFVILDEDLVDDEVPQTFNLEVINGAPAHVGRLRLSVTDSVHPDYWELGEFEAWGILE